MNENDEPVLVLVSNDAITFGEVREAFPSQIELVHTNKLDQARKLLSSRGAEVDVLLCDWGVKVEECAALFNEVEQHFPHVQCALACLETDISRVLATKNMVTSMSVFRLPWEPTEVEKLFVSLVDRAAGARRREGMLWKSLVDDFRRTRDNRMFACFQTFAGEQHGPKGGKLLPYFSVARQIQEGEAMADLKTFDSFAHTADEAKRMVEIVAHVKRWWKHFENAGDPAQLPEIFEVVEDSIRIKDVALQMEPINGECNQVPEFDACALLAWLLFQPQKMNIRRSETQDVWVVEAAASQGPDEATAEPLTVLPLPR
jgi:hypothetical protein